MLSDSGQVEDNVVQDDQSDQSIDTTEEAGQVDQPTKDKENNGPPEGSPRWKKIYRKAKESDRLKAELEELKETLKQSTESSNELISEIRSNKDAETLASIERKINEAFDGGDKDAHDVAIQELYEFKKSNAEKQRVTTPSEPVDYNQLYVDRNPEFKDDENFYELTVKNETAVKKDPYFKDATDAQVISEIERRTRAEYSNYKNAVQNPYLQQSSLTSAGSDSPPITEKKESPSEAYLSSMSEKEKDAIYEIQKQYHPGKSRDEILDTVASYAPQGS